MSGVDSKARLVDFVRAQTPGALWERLEELSAGSIARQLGLSRTVVSQYLNEAAAEGVLVKINSRPVSFLHREALVGAKDAPLLEGSYESASALRAAAAPLGHGGSVFGALIGAAGSLSYHVEQCKAAITYPGAGLPILLHGPTGTGKSLLARLMYDYGVEKGVLESDSRFVTVNCAEYANNPELLLTNLFGHRKGAYTGADRDRKGLIAMADGGILFLDEVHCLTGECQEKLFLFMDQGIYHMTGDNETWYSSKVRLVMATTETPEIALLKTMLRRIPIVTKLPSLADRPLQEKKELLYRLFQSEAERVEREVAVSGQAYETLLDYIFTENVGQMRNCIRASMANAMLESKAPAPAVLEVHLQHLPPYLLQSGAARLWEGSGKRALLTLAQLQEQQQGEQRLYRFNSDLIDQIGQVGDQSKSPEDFFAACRIRLEQYLDDLYTAPAKEDNPRRALYSDLLKSICESVGKKFGLTFRRHDVLNLCRLVNDYAANAATCEALLRRHQEEILAGIELFRTRRAQDYQIVQELGKMIGGGMNLNLGQLGILDLCVCFRSFAARFDQRKAVGVIVAHGYSTASSMAATANHLLGQHIYEAIDMPMDVHSSVIVSRLSDYLGSLSGVKDVVILVDMGSLEELHRGIENADNMNLAILNNVTIRLALTVGELIEKDAGVGAIVAECTARPTVHDHVLLENRKRPMAILSVCATGLGTAERISALLTKSFPRTIPLQVLPYHFGSLAAGGRKAAVFEKYEVLFIVGTDDPGLEGYPFFSLEDLLEQRSVGEMNGLLSAYFDPTELREFNANLVKQFSLQNLLDHLTILNPEKVIGYVEVIVRRLEHLTGRRFRNAVVVGLYIHISCLIERLLTDRYIVNYENLEEFQRDHADFIEKVRESFADVGKDYGVGIPDSEIGYLFEYIYRLG
ncbi:MAG TPA: sigma 54-interacting transcriptional regulator [Pseudoflavonifractor sp.]|nr:sigma 54-interacting transcriptional regulator [Pseudoflavonifractor sp.]